MERSRNNKLFLQNAEKYRIMDSSEKKDLIIQIVTKNKELKGKKHSSTHSLDYYIEQFNPAIKECPLLYLCSVH